MLWSFIFKVNKNQEMKMKINEFVPPAVSFAVNFKGII